MAQCRNHILPAALDMINIMVKKLGGKLISKAPLSTLLQFTMAFKWKILSCVFKLHQETHIYLQEEGGTHSRFAE